MFSTFASLHSQHLVPRGTGCVSRTWCSLGTNVFTARRFQVAVSGVPWTVTQFLICIGSKQLVSFMKFFLAQRHRGSVFSCQILGILRLSCAELRKLSLDVVDPWEYVTFHFVGISSSTREGVLCERGWNGHFFPPRRCICLCWVGFPFYVFFSSAAPPSFWGKS